MSSQSDSDAGSSSLRPRRDSRIPTNARDYVHKYLPTRAAQAKQTSPSPDVSASSGKKRSRFEQEDRLSSATPEGSDPPTPTQERENPDDEPAAKRPRNGKAKASELEALLDLQYSELTTDSDQIDWLVGMLEPRTGRDYASRNFSLAQLEQIYSTQTGVELRKPASREPKGRPVQRTDSMTLPPGIRKPKPSQGPGASGHAATPSTSATTRSTYRLGAVTPVPSPSAAPSKRVPTSGLKLLSPRNPPATRPGHAAPHPKAPSPVHQQPAEPSPEIDDHNSGAEGDTEPEVDHEQIRREFEAEMARLDEEELARIRQQDVERNAARERRRAELRQQEEEDQRRLEEDRRRYEETEEEQQRREARERDERQRQEDRRREREQKAERERLHAQKPGRNGGQQWDQDTGRGRASRSRSSSNRPDGDGQPRQTSSRKKPGRRLNHKPVRPHSDRESSQSREAGTDEEDSDDCNAPLVYYATMRQRAQRNNFAPLARPLVDALVDRLHYRAVHDNPYADVTPVFSEPDEEGNTFQTGFLLDQIVIDEWGAINRELRSGRAPLLLLAEYIVYAKHVYTQVWNFVKKVALGFVESAYDLGLEFEPDDIKARVPDLLSDSFHATDLQPGKYDFHHPILINCIKQAHFDVPGKAIGCKYSAQFRPMPLPTIALHCATIRFLISTYASGHPYKKTRLDATNQREWYAYYLEHLEEASLPGKNPIRISNLTKRMFDKCYQTAKPLDSVPARKERKYEADSETEYTSVVQLPGQD